MKIKYFLIFLILTSCSKPFKYKEINGEWQILKLDRGNTQILDFNNISVSNFIFLTTKHSKIFIKINEEKEVKGDFKIIQNKTQDSLEIFNASTPIYNGKYKIILDTMPKSRFATKTNLILQSENIKILGRKTEINPH